VTAFRYVSSQNNMRFLLFLFFFAGLYPASGQRYKKIHSQAFIADTHNDILMRSMDGLQIDTDLKGQTHTDIGRLIQANYGAQVFSVFFDERYGKDSAFRFAIRDIDSLYAIAARNSGRLMMVRNAGELKQARKAHKLAALIGVEGGHLIEERMEYLDSLYSRGARYLTLTWNNSTSWASSAADESKNNLPFGYKGLNDFGKSIVKHMNEIGMMVDVSHVGEQTFDDAIAISTKPVIASHSSVYALCPVPRNLKDDQIRAIAKSGGVVFINFYSGFLDSTYFSKNAAFQKTHANETDSLTVLKWPAFEIGTYLSNKYKAEADLIRPDLSVLIDHIDYVKKLVGVDYVGLGSDFDGIESAPKGLDDVTDLSKITRALVDRGYSKKDIRKILGGNFLRVLNAVCTR
jgi:membrane dipeptidase